MFIVTKVKLASSVFLSKMIAKLEWAFAATSQNKDETRKPHTLWEHQQTMNQQQ